MWKPFPLNIKTTIWPIVFKLNKMSPIISSRRPPIVCGGMMLEGQGHSDNECENQLTHILLINVWVTVTLNHDLQVLKLIIVIRGLYVFYTYFLFYTLWYYILLNIFLYFVLFVRVDVAMRNIWPFFNKYFYLLHTRWVFFSLCFQC